MLIENIASDSRLVKKNGMFFSVSGSNLNGRDFQKKAIENCASCSKGYIRVSTFVNKDGVVPSANSVMCKNLFLLSHHTGNRDFLNIGKSMLNEISTQLISNPLDYMNWLSVSLDYYDKFYEVVISGKKSIEMAKEINSIYLPNILIATSKRDSEKYLLKNRYIKGENLIYVCVNNTCKYPVNNVEAALKLITNNNE